jgi:beta-lactamase regulating signal transducer with metallopeptidase domain
MMFRLALVGLIPVTAVTAIGLVLLRLLVNSSALVRRQVVISTLIVASAFAFLPLAPGPILNRLPSTHYPQPIQPMKDLAQVPMAVALPSLTEAESPTHKQITLTEVSESLTLFVTTLLLSRWIFGLISAFLLRLRSKPYATALTTLPVRWTPGLDVPASLGGLRSVILLPEDCLTLESSDLEPILLHEETHIRNRDHLWNTLAEVLCAFHWFNPLVWMLRRTLRLESEHVADDQVVLAGHNAPGYASLLLRFQRKARKLRPIPLHAIATRNAMTSRFKSILEPNTRRSVMNPRKSLLLAGLAGLIALPLVLGFLAPSSFVVDTPHSGQLKSGAEARKVELVQVGRKIGDSVEVWDSAGNPVPPKEQIAHYWRAEEIGRTGIVQRYLHIVFRVEAKEGDMQPETGVGSPSHSRAMVDGLQMGYASSDFLFTKDNWHYFVDHLSVGPLDTSEFPGAAVPPELKGVRDLGRRLLEPTVIGITFSAGHWTDEGSVATKAWTKSITIEPAGKLPKGFGLEKISNVWSKLTFVTENEPVDDAMEFDAYLKDGSKLPEKLVQGSFGQYESKNPNLLDNVYYIGAPVDKFDHLSQRTRPSFNGDLEVPLSPNSDRKPGATEIKP